MTPIRQVWHETTRLFRWMVLLLLFVYACSGIYVISEREVGLREHLGQPQHPPVPPGIHMAWPYPIDRIYKIPIREMLTMEILAFSDESNSADRYLLAGALPMYGISGDNNMLNLRFVVQYMISDPTAFHYHSANAKSILRTIARSAMLHTLADLPVNAVLTDGKTTIEIRVRDLINRQLQSLDSGLEVSFIELVSASPPPSVQAAFDDVVNAQIDQRRLANEAETYVNQRTLEARATAEQAMQEAYAYQDRVTKAAQGQTQRFLKQASVYRTNPSSHALRLWQQHWQAIAPKLQRLLVVDQHQDQPLTTIRTPLNTR